MIRTKTLLMTVAVGASLLASVSAIAIDSPLVMRFDSGFDEVATTVVTDSSGNAYVGARVESTERKNEFAILKYALNGTLLWTARYSNALHDADGGQVNSIAVDAAGNVYAAGYIYKTVSLFVLNMDWLVVSYTPDGIERWSHRINGTSNVWDSANAIAIDRSGNVYVDGTIDDAATSSTAGWTLIKYAPNGNVIWRHTNVRADGARDTLGQLFVDSTGHVLGVGKTSPHGIATTKIDPTGAVVWRSVFEASAISDDVALDAALDSNDNLYWTGETVESTNPELAHVPITLKYNSAGVLQYILQGDGAGGTSVAIDSTGDVIVSGTSFREGGMVGLVATSKYSAAGNRKWLTPNVAGQLAVDSAGSIYTFDTIQVFNDGSNNSDLLTSKLNGDGSTAWQHRFNGRVVPTATQFDRAVTSVIDPFDNVLEVGNASEGINDDIVTLRYAAGVTPQSPPASISAPSGLSATASSGRVTLNWSDNSNNEASFAIERCVGKTCTAFTQVGTVGANTRTYVDAAVARSTTYRYRVRAVNGPTTSPYSNIATATTPKR